MKNFVCICLGIWILLLLGGCRKNVADDAEDLNNRVVGLEQRQRQAVHLIESEIARLERKGDFVESQMEGRQNRSNNFFGRIAGIFVSEETKAAAAAGDTEQKGITQKYSILYQVLHGEHADAYTHAKPEVEKAISDSALKVKKLYPETKVFGWHPHWMNGAYQGYNFNLLTHVSYFAYDVDPTTGRYRNPDAIRGWRTTGLVDSAHKAGCKVLLTVSNHGRVNNDIFLTNPLAQEALIDSLLLLLAFRNADGIDLDFEAIPAGRNYDFSAFVSKLHGRLALAPKDYIITVCVPAINPGVFDIKNLQKWVDYFLIMGYDLHGSRSQIAGPVSPLQNGKTWNSFNLQNSVSQYLKLGTPRSKVIMALPYYGAMWKTDGPEPGSSVQQFLRHLTYKEIVTNYDESLDSTYKKEYDLESDSRYFVFRNEADDSYTQCWYDDSTTLDKKMKYLQTQGIAGVGFWALGYDNGLPEFWRLISRRYAVPSKDFQSNIADSRRFGVIGWIRKYQNPLLATGFFILLFLVLGFLLSLADWRVRDALFYSGSSRLMYIAIIFSLTIGVFTLLGIIKNTALILAGGLAFGLAVTMMINKLTLRRRRTLP